jgi:hypothetical protein
VLAGNLSLTTCTTAFPTQESLSVSSDDWDAQLVYDGDVIAPASARVSSDDTGLPEGAASYEDDFNLDAYVNLQVRAQQASGS